MTQRLWSAVLAQAIEDAMSRRTTTEALRNKREALDWLLGDSADFALVCSLVGLDPEAVRDRVRRHPGVLKLLSKNRKDQSFPSKQEMTQLEFSAP